jgi:hypothetical protein
MIPRICLTALAVACAAPAETDLPDTDRPPSGCPEGLYPTTNAGLVATRFRLDGLDYPVTFDANSNSPSLACISPAADSMALTFVIDQIPFGTLFVTTAYDLSTSAAEAAGAFRIDLHGAPVPILIAEPTDWQSGVVEITHPNGAIAFEIDGVAVPPGHALSLRLSAEARPEI